VGGGSEGLSITSTDNVLVTLSRFRLIKEYTPDGGLIRVISFDNSIEFPQHSVQLSSNLFVVSHGWTGTLHRVCIVDTRGHIIQCYGESPGSGIGQLDFPGYLAVDRPGNVLVTDSLNNRVVLLSPLLTQLGYIEIPGHELNQPYALHLDELNHRLYIGEYPD